MNSTLKRKKSISSQAASISAWWAVFDWPSIVAAFSVARQGPESSSAARRKTAARSSQGSRDQSCHASPAASIARSTSFAPPWCTSARTWLFRCGMSAVDDVDPADDERELDALALHFRQAALKLSALWRARRVVLDRLVRRLRRPEDAWTAHAGDCIRACRS